MDLLEELKDKWNDKVALTSYLLVVIGKQLQLAENIAASEASLNAAFISEREEAYKGTDSMARARAKSLVGTDGVRYEYEFQTLTNLIQIITLRISQL